MQRHAWLTQLFIEQLFIETATALALVGIAVAVAVAVTILGRRTARRTAA